MKGKITKKDNYLNYVIAFEDMFNRERFKRVTECKSDVSKERQCHEGRIGSG